MDKSKLSETDICEKFISPALTAAGWDVHEQILREVPLRPGRIVVRGQKASRDGKSLLRADYVLFWKANIPLAVIEAKDNTQAVGAGMPQALTYAELLGVPFVFASNGDGFVFRDATLATGTLETNLGLDQFPSPTDLWARLCAHRGRTPEEQAVAGPAYSPSKTTRQVDKSYEIYLSLYQAVSGTDEEQNIYRQFSPDFFDLIVVDECHRGSADEDSAWRELLTYFSGATQIGLTATPKETEHVSNAEYFGEPVYTYSLRQGIEDGYLAPYKVIRVDLDKDTFGWRPTEGMTDKLGNVIEDRIYNATDMNRKLVLERRDEVVAARITEYLKATDRYAKTIVFCEDIDHANRMRQALSNANADLCKDHPKYVVQITGDNEEGKRELDNFIDPEKRYPVIATTSRLMSTGVDAQTCKLIVLDQSIRSMTLFKQIIGRGTRLHEDLGKTWFTILDFKRATDNFADPTFDGDPVQIYEPRGDEPVVPPEPEAPAEPAPGAAFDASGFDPAVFGGGEAGPPEVRRYIVGNAVNVAVARERVQYLNAQGRLITESLRDYTRINVTRQFDSLDKFLQAWSDADRKAALIEALESEGVLFDALADEVGRDLDPFDLLLHVAYDMPPLTRRERAEFARARVKKRNAFAKYGETARKVIEALLDKYADEGVQTLESIEVLRVPPLDKLGTPTELVKSFGGRAQYDTALRSLENELYSPGP